MAALSIPLLLLRTRKLFTNKIFLAALLFGAFSFVIWKTHTAAYEAGKDSESLRSAEQTIEDMTRMMDEISEFYDKRERAEREQDKILDELRQERSALFERLRREEDEFSAEFSNCFDMPVPDGLRAEPREAGARDNLSGP